VKVVVYLEVMITLRHQYHEDAAELQPDSMNPELQAKLGRVRAMMRDGGFEAALIGRQANFSWLSCGGEAHVPLTTERSFGQLLVTPDRVHLLANAIEMPRLQAEVVKSLGFEPLEFAWHDGSAPALLKSVVNLKTTVADIGEHGLKPRPELFSPLRYSLEPAEVRRHRALGADASAALGAACGLAQPGMSEFELAALVASQALERGMTPVVLLVAVDERIRQFRHPLPTSKVLKRHAMLVLCARRHGLIASLTRLCHFGKPSADLLKRHRAVCEVDATFISSTRVGTPAREIFRRGVAEYAAQGFKDEWTLHHQGGACGYETRDYLGSPGAVGVAQARQPFAWNPSIAGTKSEDTILATERGPEILTEAMNWPMVEVGRNGEVLRRPDILVV
jgi:Xaa-Pro aminopeptidase